MRGALLLLVLVIICPAVASHATAISLASVSPSTTPQVSSSAAAPLPPVADMVGLRVGITDKGLKYAAKIALPLVLAQLSDLKIPDLPFDKDGFEGKVSSITCQNVDISELAIDANLTGSVALAATGLEALVE